MMSQKVLSTLFLASLLCVSAFPQKALALSSLSDTTINQAVRYGIENRESGLSSFLGGNWIEGQDGALLNIYTPYMTIARAVAHKDFGTLRPSDDVVAQARKSVIEDISYNFTHPTVKFLVSMYGDNSAFAKNYFARIEGVGRGRTFTVYPTKTIPQNLATQEKDVTYHPFTAVNSYQFKFEDIAPMDEFALVLYGKGVEPVSFKINAHDIQ